MALQAKGLLRVCIHHFAYRTKSHGQMRKDFSFNRKSRFIAKLLAENASERKQWRKGHVTHKVFGSSNLSPKRLETLNKIFLATITDGLTSSTRCDELANLGLMVNRAELSPSGQTLKVMWSSCSSEGDKEVANILEECQAELRHNIVTKSVGGFVPRIMFTKDIKATRIRDLEYIFHLPSLVRDLQTELPKDEPFVEVQDDGDRFKIEISTNILGLKREDVLRRVMATAKRLRKAERRRKEEGSGVEEESEVSVEIPDRLSNIDVRKQKLAIADFLRNQKRAEKKKFLNVVEQTRYRNQYVEEVYVDSVGDELDEVYEEESYLSSVDSEEKYSMNADETVPINLEKSVSKTAEVDIKNDLLER